MALCVVPWWPHHGCGACRIAVADCLYGSDYRPRGETSAGHCRAIHENVVEPRGRCQQRRGRRTVLEREHGLDVRRRVRELQLLFTGRAGWQHRALLREATLGQLLPGMQQPLWPFLRRRCAAPACDGSWRSPSSQGLEVWRGRLWPMALWKRSVQRHLFAAHEHHTSDGRFE